MAFRTNKTPVLQEKSVSGAVATFNTALAMPLASCNIAVNAWQEGSGTPSPDNVIKISGWDAIHIGNISDNINISYFQGLLNGTYGFVDLGSLTWYMNTAGQFYTAQTNPTGEQDLTGSNLICSDKYTGGNAYTGDTDKTICIVGESLGRIWIKDSEYSDVTIFKNSLSGVYLIYELKTPTTPSFTSAEFEALCESFGINGQSFTIQIGSTIYGGEYDARTGVLTCTWWGERMDNYTWYRNTSYDYPFFYASQAGVDKTENVTNIMCSCYDAIYTRKASNFRRVNLDGKIAIISNATYVFAIQDSSITTEADFNNSLGDNMIVYKLSTPTTIQLPPCPIDTLQGQNNIFCDTGNIDLTYKDLDIAKRGNFREVFKLPS